MGSYNLLKTTCEKCGLIYFVDDSEEAGLIDFVNDTATPLHCPRCLHVAESHEMNIECEIDDE